MKRIAGIAFWVWILFLAGWLIAGTGGYLSAGVVDNFGNISGIVKGNGAGTYSAATAGVDYANPLAGYSFQTYGTGDPTSSILSQFYFDYASGYSWINVGGLWQRFGNPTYDYYVDETATGCAGSGCSDSNNGRTPTTAFLTLHKVDTLSVASTTQVAWKAADGTWISAPPWTGILAEFDFIGSGSTLTDRSGSGNNGTLGAAGAAPSWTSAGMTFSGGQYVTLAINGLTTRSIASLASINSANIGSYQILVGVSSASFTYTYDAWADRSNLYTQGSYSSTAADTAIGNWNDVAFNNPFLFISSYGSGATNAWFNGMKIPITRTGSPDSANVVTIGSDKNHAFYLYGVFSRLLIYNRALTDADSVSIQRWMYLAELKQARGIAVPSFLLHPGHTRIFCAGDSLTSGSWAASPAGSYPSQLRTSLANYDVINVGSAGINSTNFLSWEGYSVSVDTRYPNEVIVVWIGHNDLTAGTSTSTTLSNITSYCNAARAMGYKVIVMSVIPWTGETGAQETNRQTLNGLIASGWSTFADGYVDLNTDSRLETPGNLTYFYSDGIHLTNAGYGAVAGMVQAAITPFLK